MSRPSGRVRIPADVDREDRILAGLTARQLAILSVAALALWAGYAFSRHRVPLAAYAAVALPVAALAAALALGRLEGMAADRWLGAAWRHRASPHRLVPAPDPLLSPPAFLASSAQAPSALSLPFAGVDAGGTIDLGDDGAALLCRASAVTFSLRSPAEQEALVAGFGRWLNSLSAPVQVLVRAEPLDLGPAISALLAAAPGLPHPALEVAARGHARFLADLAIRRDLLRREVLVVLRETPGLEAPGRLQRRASEAVSGLGAAGVSVTVMDGPAAARCLAQALDPAAPERSVLGGAVDTPVTLARGKA